MVYVACKKRKDRGRVAIAVCAKCEDRGTCRAYIKTVQEMEQPKGGK